MRVCDNHGEHLDDGFDDVIWSDETTVQLETHRHSYRKKRQQATLKPCPKHPIKLHVWASINKRGAMPVVIVTGTMDAELYTTILEMTLVPFIHKTYRLT